MPDDHVTEVVELSQGRRFLVVDGKNYLIEKEKKKITKLYLLECTELTVYVRCFLQPKDVEDVAR